MTDIEFFTKIVAPAVDEFSRNPGDLLRGVTACIMLQSMTEHYFWQHKADPAKSREENEPALVAFKRELRDTNRLYGEIADIANGMKHAKEKFSNLRDDRAPGVCGVLRAGFPLSSQPYVFTDDKYEWLLYKITEEVLKMWETCLGIV